MLTLPISVPFPDAPGSTMHRAGLTARIEAHYFATLKWDGWRCLTIRTPDGVSFQSKTGKTLPVSPECAARVAPYLMPLPVGTILDGEWQGRRPAFRQEALWVFDAIAIPLDDGPAGAHDVRGLGAWERFERASRLVPALITPHAESDFAGFFDYHKSRPDAEGIVLKRRTSIYIGSVSTCATNSAWIRCKWRAGESGESPIV